MKRLIVNGEEKDVVDVKEVFLQTGVTAFRRGNEFFILVYDDGDWKFIDPIDQSSRDKATNADWSIMNAMADGNKVYHFDNMREVAEWLLQDIES